MMGHQPYCDHRHTAGQECNTARRIGAAAEWPPHDAPAELAAPRPTPLLEQPEAVPLSLRREAIAASEMAPPSGYVAREWYETAAHVEASPDAAPTPEPPAASTRGGRVSRKQAAAVAMSALLVAALAACFLHDADIVGDD